MKPIPKRAHSREALIFRRAVADRLQLLASVLGEKTEIARIMGISKSRFSNWMSSDNPLLPSVEPLIRLCESTGCTLDFIFRDVRAGLTAGLAAKIRDAEAELARTQGTNVSRFEPGPRKPSAPRRQAE